MHDNEPIIQYERLIEQAGSHLILDHGRLQMAAFVNKDGTLHLTFAAAQEIANVGESQPVMIGDGTTAVGSERCGDGDQCASLTYPDGQLLVFSEGAALRQPYKTVFVQMHKDAPVISDTRALDNAGTTLIFDQGRTLLHITLNDDGTLRFLATPISAALDASADDPGLNVTFPNGTVASGAEQCGDAERCASVTFTDGDQLLFYAIGTDLNQAGDILVQRISGGKTVYEYERRLQGATTFTIDHGLVRLNANVNKDLTMRFVFAAAPPP